MVQYSDIHLEDLKKLSIKSFTEVLINDFYPFIYSEITKMESCIGEMKSEYDVDILESTQKKIYSEFDELFRKEKLVLFPYIIKLDDENTKSENCTPFKNTKLHYTSMMNHLNNAGEIVSNYFISTLNTEAVNCLNNTIYELKESMFEIQHIKEKHFYTHYKGCGGCQSKHE